MLNKEASGPINAPSQASRPSCPILLLLTLLLPLPRLQPLRISAELPRDWVCQCWHGRAVWGKGAVQVGPCKGEGLLGLTRWVLQIESWLLHLWAAWGHLRWWRVCQVPAGQGVLWESKVLVEGQERLVVLWEGGRASEVEEWVRGL